MLPSLGRSAQWLPEIDSDLRRIFAIFKHLSPDIRQHVFAQANPFPVWSFYASCSLGKLQAEHRFVNFICSWSRDLPSASSVCTHYVYKFRFCLSDSMSSTTPYIDECRSSNSTISCCRTISVYKFSQIGKTNIHHTKLASRKRAQSRRNTQ